MAQLLKIVKEQKNHMVHDFAVKKEFDNVAEEHAWVYEEKNEAHWAIRRPQGGDMEPEMLDATLVKTVDTAGTIMWLAAQVYDARVQ